MAKRGQNEGTIFEEKPGRWVASISLGYEVRNGKRRRIRKKFVGDTRKDVQRRLTEALGKQDKGEHVERGRTSFKTAIHRWLDEVARRQLQPSTLVSYESLIKNHIEPALGSILLTQIQPDAIDRFMAKKQADGLSARSVQYCHAIIRRALGQAVKWRMIGYNAARDATPPKSDAAMVSPFTPEQARAFLLAIAGDRLEALFTVAMAVGLRRGEALGLSWVDLDLDRRTLTVRQTLQRLKGKLVLGPTKTKKSARMVSLPAFSVEAFRRHKEKQDAERLFAGDEWVENGLVFTTRKGTPVEPRNALRHFQRLLEVVGLPRHRLHDLRHTAASLLLFQGADLHEVKETLGHSQIKLTSDLYGHMYDAAKQRTADRMDEAMAPRSPVAPRVAPLNGISKPN